MNATRDWHELRPTLTRVARSLTRDAADADDLVQTAFLKLIEHGGAQARVTCLRAWLQTVVRRLAIDRSRRQCRWRWAAIDEDDELPSIAVNEENVPTWSAIEPEQLQTAIGLCKPIYRQVFVRHYQLGQSYEQIARELALPIGTVATRLHRARTSIRAVLQTSSRDVLRGKKARERRHTARGLRERG